MLQHILALLLFALRLVSWMLFLDRSTQNALKMRVQQVDAVRRNALTAVQFTPFLRTDVVQ